MVETRDAGELSELLIEMIRVNGFDWLLEDMAALDPERTDPALLALNLLSAIEAATLDLAGVERTTIQRLDLQAISFRAPDDNRDGSPEITISRDRSRLLSAVLESRGAFDQLRRVIRGD